MAVVLVACQGAPEPASVTPAPSGDAREEEAPDQGAEAVMITDPSQREAAVGKRVVVIGVQTRTKMPQVNGVDVDGDYELSDRRVRVEGILRKWVVEPTEPDPDELPIATRGPGTYYSVVDPTTWRLARPRPE